MVYDQGMNILDLILYATPPVWDDDGVSVWHLGDLEVHARLISETGEIDHPIYEIVSTDLL